MQIQGHYCMVNDALRPEAKQYAFLIDDRVTRVRTEAKISAEFLGGKCLLIRLHDGKGLQIDDFLSSVLRILEIKFVDSTVPLKDEARYWVFQGLV